MNESISNFVISMREFQRKNNCITNVQYLYDTIKMNSKNTNVKTRAVFVFSYDDTTKSTSQYEINTYSFLKT